MRECKSGHREVRKSPNQSCIFYNSNWCHHLWRINLLQAAATKSHALYSIQILAFCETKFSFPAESEAPSGQGLCKTPFSCPLWRPEECLAHSECLVFICATLAVLSGKVRALCRWSLLLLTIWPNILLCGFLPIFPQNSWTPTGHSERL